MMSKNSIVPFLKDYLIKFLTRPFLLDTNEMRIKISKLLYETVQEDYCIIFCSVIQNVVKNSILMNVFRFLILSGRRK